MASHSLPSHRPQLLLSPGVHFCLVTHHDMPFPCGYPHTAIFLSLIAAPAGYSFYSHLVSTRMLPLRRLVRWTRTAHSQLGFDAGDRRVLFAASHK